MRFGKDQRRADFQRMTKPAGGADQDAIIPQEVDDTPGQKRRGLALVVDDIDPEEQAGPARGGEADFAEDRLSLHSLFLSNDSLLPGIREDLCPYARGRDVDRSGDS